MSSILKNYFQCLQIVQTLLFCLMDRAAFLEAEALMVQDLTAQISMPCSPGLLKTSQHCLIFSFFFPGLHFFAVYHFLLQIPSSDSHFFFTFTQNFPPAGVSGCSQSLWRSCYPKKEMMG